MVCDCSATVQLLFGKDTFYLFGGTVTVVSQNKNKLGLTSLRKAELIRGSL